MSRLKNLREISVNIKKLNNKGRFIKPCPGTPNYVCCGYQIIDFAHGCSLGCTYCILNYYFKNEPVTIFKNRKKLFDELEEFLEKREGITRFGTGEFTDSLLLEQALPLYNELIPYISNNNKAVLELKTKTANIEGILKIKEHRNTILSWSVNSIYVAQKEERYAPGIDTRIDAAFRVQESGYKLAFHFDPIIIHENWEAEYRKTIDLIFKKVHPENIVYISMGTLRFIPEMKHLMEKMDTGYRGGELIKGSDNKMRYFRPLRTLVYQKIKTYLKNYVDENVIYMCMENPTVWEDIFNISHMTSKKLITRLDNACLNKFDIIS